LTDIEQILPKGGFRTAYIFPQKQVERLGEVMLAQPLDSELVRGWRNLVVHKEGGALSAPILIGGVPFPMCLLL
jgi:hypothetical protein